VYLDTYDVSSATAANGLLRSVVDTRRKSPRGRVPVALDALDVLLAQAIPVLGLASRLVVHAAVHHAAAVFAARGAEIEMVFGAPVALVARHARATLAFPLAVALQTPRACGVHAR